MRDLEKNKRSFWLVNPITGVENVDSNGFLTGEFVHSYSSPVKIRISVYPATGTIVEEIFGKDYSCDLIAVSNEVVLTEDSLLFINEPSINFDTTYDYFVDKKLESINGSQYALRRKP